MTKQALPRLLSLLLLLAFTAPSIWAETTEDEKEATQKAAKEERERKETLKKRLAKEQVIKAEFEYSFGDIADKLVTVSCSSEQGRSSGSGFTAVMNGKTYLFTNQHVIMGSDKISFKTATGTTLRPRSVELSTTRDIARLLLAEGDGFEVSNTMAMGNPIGVFGNSEGGGVATELYGKVTKLGSEVIEVSADFVSGNSGSPVLNLDRQVIGIATYVRVSSGDKADSKTRRFCYRLTDNTWKSVNWKKYNDKYGKLYRDYDELIDSIFAAANQWYDDPFNRVSAEDHPDSGLRKWSRDHNLMVNKINRIRGERISQHKLDNTNKQIQNDLGDSAESLSEVCRDRARQMRMLAKQRELTDFLRDQFESFSSRLEYAAMQIDAYGKKLSKLNYFYFE